MLDISNKLHALVDEFVSTLSSECDSLAHNISGQAQMYVAHDIGATATTTPRQSNRTTSEVLNGLRCPDGINSMDNLLSQVQSPVEHASRDITGGTLRNRDGGMNVRPVRDMEPSSSTLEGTDSQNDVRSVDYDSPCKLSADEAMHGFGTHDLAAIGKFMDAIDILSSETSSDDSLRALLKYSKQKTQKHSGTKIRKTYTRGHPPMPHTQSPLMSRDNSQ